MGQLRIEEERKLEYEAIRVTKYKVSKRFEKGLTQVSFNVWHFRYQLVISQTFYDHLGLKLLESFNSKWPTNEEFVFIESNGLDDHKEYK